MASKGTTTSKKALEFATAPLRVDDGTRAFKPVSVLPGIGPVASEALKEVGFTTVAHLLGQFLLFSCDEDLMLAWLEEKLPKAIGAHHRKATVTALADWANNHL